MRKKACDLWAIYLKYHLLTHSYAIHHIIPCPITKKMERAKNGSDTSFSDIIEVRQQCLNFNEACLLSKTESIASIRKEMQNMVHNIKFTGMFIIKDISFNEQTQARQLLES